MSDKVIKKHQFQIRKVPLKRFPPEKLPQLYALDIHSICLPKKKKKNSESTSINYDAEKLIQQNYNDKIFSSQIYQLLYSKYTLTKQQKQREKQILQQELNIMAQKIEKQKNQRSRLESVRDNFCNETQNLREELTQCRNKSYNLRWEIYHQRGTYFVNASNYPFLDNPDTTYQDYLLLEEQMGNVSRGLNQIELALLPKITYEEGHPQSSQIEKNIEKDSLGQKTFTKEICCICYDQINQGEYITILKCKHIHHCDCIKDWLAKQKNCPICKKEVVLDEFHLRKNQKKNQDKTILE